MVCHALRAYQLVVFNIGKLKEPLGSDTVAEFERALGPINDLALVSPGYVWQYSPSTDEERKRNTVGIPIFENELMMPQLSVWEDAESVDHYVIKSGHGSYLKRRKEWFDKLPEPYGVCYWRPSPEPWVPPTLEEAVAKMEMLKSTAPLSMLFLFGRFLSGPRRLM